MDAHPLIVRIAELEAALDDARSNLRAANDKVDELVVDNADYQRKQEELINALKDIRLTIAKKRHTSEPHIVLLDVYNKAVECTKWEF